MKPLLKFIFIFSLLLLSPFIIFKQNFQQIYKVGSDIRINFSISEKKQNVSIIKHNNKEISLTQEVKSAAINSIIDKIVNMFTNLPLILYIGYDKYEELKIVYTTAKIYIMNVIV